MSNHRTRLAPTPSGFLHLGNAVNFVVTWALARHAGGEVLLRIDDVDRSRVRDEYVENVFDTIRWLGIDYDRGPQSLKEFKDSWSQVLRYPRYEEVLTELRQAGHLFACTCSRAQIREESIGMRYPGTCLNAGHDLDAPGVSWRLRTPSDLTLRYVVVRQKEGTPAYNLASVVDDVDFGITHIVRGSDLEPATEVQRHLATLAPGLAPFNLIHITHHPLITGADGQKLSKGQGAMGLRRLVDAGLTRELVFAEAARLMWLTAGELQGFVS